MRLSILEISLSICVLARCSCQQRHTHSGMKHILKHRNSHTKAPTESHTESHTEAHRRVFSEDALRRAPCWPASAGTFLCGSFRCCRRWRPARRRVDRWIVERSPLCNFCNFQNVCRQSLEKERKNAKTLKFLAL